MPYRSKAQAAALHAKAARGEIAEPVVDEFGAATKAKRGGLGAPPERAQKKSEGGEIKSRFQILREEGRHFVAHNGRGEFRIAKGGLPPHRVEKFRGMCKGGEVKLAEGGEVPSVLDKAKDVALSGARKVGEFVAPNADTIGAKGIAGIRSLFSGDSYENELERYNEAANPDPWASPASRWGKSVVEDPRTQAPADRVREAIMDPRETAQTMAMAGGLAAPIAYHGSPHVFDRFSMEKIGTGEGAQAYGHGLYFTSEPQVAEGYRRGVSAAKSAGTWSESGRRLAGPGDRVSTAAAQAEQELTNAFNHKPSDLQGAYREVLEGWRRVAKFDPEWAGSAVEHLSAMDPKSFARHHPEGAFYQVDIPDSLLDYDGPVAAQSPDVLKKLVEGGILERDGDVYRVIAPGSSRDRNRLGQMTGRDLYAALSDSARVAAAGEGPLPPAGIGNPSSSERLRSAGISGHRYKGDTSGVENYVIYDDAQIKPLGRYPSLADFKKAQEAATKPQQHAHGGEIKGTSMNLKNVRLVKETPEAWHMEGGGKPFRVAKGAVSEKIRRAITQHFAAGGEVDYAPAADVAALAQDVIPPPPAIPDAPQNPPAADLSIYTNDQLRSLAANTDDPRIQQAVATEAQDRLGTLATPEQQQAAYNDIANVASTQTPEQGPTPPPYGNEPAGPGTLIASHAPNSVIPGIIGYTGQAAAAGAGPAMPAGIPGGFSAGPQLSRAQKDAASALQAGVDVERRQSADELVVEQQRQAALESASAEWQKNFADWQEKAEQLRKDVNDQKIDPNKYWESRGTGGKISAAIGLILGGLGSGLTRQPNAALEVIQKAIDREVDAQKAELGKKQTLLSDHYQNFQSMQVASLRTRADLLTMAAGKLQMVGTKYAGDKAQASKDYNAAQLLRQAALDRQQAAAMGMDMALKSWQLRMYPVQMEMMRRGMAYMEGGSQQGGYLPSRAPPPMGSDPMNPMKFSVEARRDAGERTLLAGGQPYLAYDKETAQKARPMLQAVENVKGIVSQLRNLSKNHTGLPGTDAADLYAKYRAALAEQWAMANGLTQPSEVTNKNLETVMPTRWDAFVRGKARFEPISRLVQERERGIHESAGLDPSVFAPQPFSR